MSVQLGGKEWKTTGNSSSIADIHCGEDASAGHIPAMPHRTGHSLVEMLVVVAIMAVVMGMVLTVFIRLILIVRSFGH